MLTKELIYKHLPDIASCLIVALDDHGEIFFINRAGTEFLGYGSEELTGKDWFKTCLPEENAKTVKEIFAQLMVGKSGQAEKAENAVITKKGERRDILWKNLILRDEAGNIVGTLGCGEDISERKQTEKEVLRAKMITENSSVIFYRLRLTRGWPLEFISNNISQYGYAAEDFLSGSLAIANIIHPDDMEKSFRETEEFFAKNKVSRNFRHEYRVVTKAGETRWVEDLAEIIRDNSGTPTHYQGTWVDITERKRMEEDLLRANIVVENSSVVLYRLRLIEGWPLEFISKNVKHWGYAPEDFLSGVLVFSKIIHPDDRKKALEEQKFFSKQTIKSFLKQEYRIIAKDGSVRWVENVSEMVRDFSIMPTHLQGTIMDITERKEAEQVINARNEELKRLNHFMIDRELKMIQLKGKIDQLEEELRQK